MTKEGYALILFLVLFFHIYANAQDKRDYIYLSGYVHGNDPSRTQGNIINFNYHRKIDSITIGDILFGNNSAICDKDGKLLFYTGGCAIIDSTHKIMENGDSINYGESWIRFCEKGYGDYPGSQNSIILPDPGNENGYYLIHKTDELIKEPKVHFYGELRYSYVDMSLNNDLGKVKKKNIAILKDTNFVTSYMSACRHINGKDWWIIQIKNFSNEYYKFLLNKEGIHFNHFQQIGPFFDDWTGIGQSAFSPDGSKWMMYGDINGSQPGQGGVLIYDFDRETGYLYNMRMIETNDSAFASGVAFSPDSRFAYISTGYDLYQADLSKGNADIEIVHIDKWDGFRDFGFPVTIGAMQLAPDCRIYVAASQTVRHMGLINKPNEKGMACDFRQHSIEFPNLIGQNSITNYPHFRIDEAEICDPTITSIFGDAVWYRRDMEVWPNPSSGVFNVELPDVGAGKIVVMNIEGQVVYERDVSNIIKDEHIDISGYPAGTYNVEFWPDRNTGSKSGD
ncbi:MAG: T9SS type A sorting domain-containing protein, partial [Deltaproteobacteria bacterium]